MRRFRIRTASQYQFPIGPGPVVAHAAELPDLNFAIYWLTSQEHRVYRNDDPIMQSGLFNFELVV